MGKAMIGEGKTFPRCMARGVSLFDSHRERLSAYELVGVYSIFEQMVIGCRMWIGSSRTVLNCT